MLSTRLLLSVEVPDLQHRRPIRWKAAASGFAVQQRAGEERVWASQVELRGPQQPQTPPNLDLVARSGGFWAARLERLPQ